MSVSPIPCGWGFAHGGGRDAGMLGKRPQPVLHGRFIRKGEAALNLLASLVTPAFFITIQMAFAIPFLLLVLGPMSVLHWRVWRRITTLAADEPGRFGVTMEFLSINSMQRSWWFYRFLFLRKYKEIDDAGFQRDCLLLKCCLVIALGLWIAGAISMTFFSTDAPRVGLAQ